MRRQTVRGRERGDLEILSSSMNLIRWTLGIWLVAEKGGMTHQFLAEWETGWLSGRTRCGRVGRTALVAACILFSALATPTPRLPTAAVRPSSRRLAHKGLSSRVEGDGRLEAWRGQGRLDGRGVT